MSGAIVSDNVKYILLGAGMLGSLSTLLNGVQTWDQLSAPQFVAGICGLISTNVIAVFISKPGTGETKIDSITKP